MQEMLLRSYVNISFYTHSSNLLHYGDGSVDVVVQTQLHSERVLDVAGWLTRVKMYVHMHSIRVALHHLHLSYSALFTLISDIV